MELFLGFVSGGRGSGLLGFGNPRRRSIDPRDYEGKAVIFHALCIAGKRISARLWVPLLTITP